MPSFLRNLQIEARKNRETIKFANFYVLYDGSFISHVDPIKRARRLMAAASMKGRIAGTYGIDHRRIALDLGKIFAEDHVPIP